ncbi:MAG: cytochrome c family protein [Hyphomicrobiaceae bacterium]|nr:MAG: cytochrome c family protein [Hyphomicrobiaceae bacterium]
MKRIAVFLLAATSLTVGGTVQAQDAANGEAVFKKCRACHLVGPEAKHTVGPQLNNVIGRKAGTIADFSSYSDQMKELGSKGLVWNDATLDKYLANPKDLVPNGKMAFPGLSDKEDRADVIAYLKTFTKK